MANVVPAIPMNNAHNNSHPKELVNPAKTIGRIRNNIVKVKTFFPPNRSVKIPMGIRMIDPNRTGVAIRILFSIVLRWNCSWIWLAIGGNTDQIINEAVMAAVERTSALVCFFIFVSFQSLWWHFYDAKFYFSKAGSSKTTFPKFKVTYHNT